MARTMKQRVIWLIAALAVLLPLWAGRSIPPASVTAHANVVVGGPPTGSYTPQTPPDGEVVARRTLHSRTVYHAGRYTTTISAGDFNYADATGALQPISTQLVPSTTPGYAYESGPNRYTARFPADIGSGPVHVQLGTAWVEFALSGIHGTGTVSDATDTYTIPGGSIAYTAEPDSLKESITLSSPSSQHVYSYTLHASPGLSFHQNSSGGIDVRSGGKSIFTLAPPTMQDAAGATSSGVSFALTPGGDASTLTLTADATWLTDPARQYPVVIDPTVSLSPPLDCAIVSSSPTSTSCGASQVEIGATGNQLHRTLLSFDLGPIPAGSTITSADFAQYLSLNFSPSPATVNLDASTRAWTGAVTWNSYDGTNSWTTPGGDFTSSPASQATIPGGTHASWEHWYPTALVQSWVNGTATNNGVELLESPETGGLLLFDGTGNSNTSLRPTLSVTYTAPPPLTTLGIRSFYTFDGPVNVATGNLVLDGTDMGMPGVGLSNGIGRTYNSQGTNLGDLGPGWLLDVGHDVNLQHQQDGSEQLSAPTGAILTFAPDGHGGYLSPPGEDATLATNGTTFTLTDHGSGSVVTFSSGNGGVPTSVTDRSGNTISYHYTGTQLSSITDTLGGVTNLSYDGNNRLTGITDPAGRTYGYAYDASGRLATYTDPENLTTQYGYTSSNLITSITDARGNVTTIAYDGNRRVTSITEPVNSSTGQAPVTTYTYSSGSTAVRDPNGNTTTYVYDSQGRVTSVTDPAGHITATTWTSNDDVATVKSPSGITGTYTYSSDGLDNLTNTKVTSADGLTSLSSSYAYGDNANPYLATSVTDSQGNTTSTTYDSRGHILTVSDPANPTKNSTYTYDTAHGNLTSAKDENGHTTNYTYDSRGMPLADTPPCPDGSTPQAPPAPPCSGTATPLGPTQYAWNSYNQEASVTDGKGQLTSYAYGTDGELQSETFANNQGNRSYGYDATGNLTQMTDMTGTSTYRYDGLGQLTNEVTPGASTLICPGTSNVGSTCYSYDNAGQLTSKQDITGKTSYAYNPDGSLASVTDRYGAKTTFAYDSDGNLTSTTYPNGVTETATYNSIGQPTSLAAKNTGNQQLTNFRYGYTDPNKNNVLTALLHSVTDGANTTTSYSYDAGNSLTGATQKTSGGTTLHSYAYGYDSNGNLTSKTVDGVGTTFSYNANNELTGATGGLSKTFSYDGNGDLTSTTTPSGTTTFNVNSAGQLTSITPPNQSAINMTYTGVGETARTASGSSSYHYDALGMNVLGQGGSNTGFTTLPDGSVIAEAIPPGTSPCPTGPNYCTYYYLSDGMGSVAGLTDSSGALADSYSYDPMGGMTSQTGSVPNPFTYGGGQYDSATGLYYTGSDYYDPVTGQTIGCVADKGQYDPGEDNCGSDADTQCGGDCAAPPPLKLVGPFAIGMCDETAQGCGGVGRGATADKGTSDQAKPEPKPRPSTSSESLFGTVASKGDLSLRAFPNDHGPPHLDLVEGKAKIRIGQNGNPLKGEPELTPKQRKFVEENKALIRNRIRKLMRWYRNQRKKP